MNTLKSICLSLLVVAGVSAGASGQPSATNINPALLYYQAFLARPNLEPADNDYLLSNTNNWRGQKLTPRFGELLAKYDAQFSLVRQAAHATVPCDWGIDRSKGPTRLMLHLARAKAVAQTARLRAMWALQQERPADACHDLVASLVLARNLSRDGTFISVLVQSAIEAIVCNAIAESFGRFSPDALQQLIEGLDAVPARGTMAAGVLNDKASFEDWASRRILELQHQNPGDDAKVMEGIRQFLGLAEPPPGEEDLWEHLMQAAGGTSDGVLQLLQERWRMYEKAAVVLALPYPEYESQMKEFSGEVEKSSNPFVTNSVPLFLKGRAKEFRIQVVLAMVRTAVEYKLHGEQGLQSVTDPCGQGPFALQRFVFQGVDRGFELKSPFDAGGFQQVLIFVEKEGPPFLIDGPHAGQALPGARAASATEAFERRYGLPRSK
jgi:hypothetical protein